MIKQNAKKVLNTLPKEVHLVVATKGRSPAQILEVIEAGIKIIGENYVQEAERKYKVIGKKVSWHLIGHLQKNKVKKALKIFDMIQTLDSIELAHLINKESYKINKRMPVLIEINIAKEPQKTGIFPEELEKFIKEVQELENLKLMGLMTMGALLSNPEDLRPYFKKTKELFERIKGKYALPDWKYLSMGMSSSYKIAIQEGANMVRIGRAIFENYEK